MSEFTSQSAAMRISLRKLEKLQRSVGAADGRSADQVEADDARRLEENKKLAALSPYQRTEFLTAKMIQELRELMRKHQDLVDANGGANGSGSKSATAEVARSRQDMRKLEDKIAKMGRDAARLARGERRDADALELMKHVRSVRKYYRQRFALVASSGYGGDGSDPADYGQPYSDPDSAAPSATNFGRGEAAPLLSPTGGEFPSVSPTATSLREDEAFQVFFTSLQQNDALIDKHFDVIHVGVHRLREQADLIKSELSIQDALIQEVESKVDKSNDKLFSLNRRLKKTLEQVDSSRMCVYVFCVLIVLGLVGGILYVTHVIGPSSSSGGQQ